MQSNKLIQVISAAHQGYRIQHEGKIIWKGLGNRSGLHSFAFTLTNDQWAKSGQRFVKKLMALQAGTVTVLEFVNRTRDIGRWQPLASFPVAGRGKRPSKQKVSLARPAEGIK